MSKRLKTTRNMRVCMYVLARACIYIYIYIYIYRYLSGPRVLFVILTRARVEGPVSHDLIIDCCRGVLFARPALGPARPLAHWVLEASSVAAWR